MQLQARRDDVSFGDEISSPVTDGNDTWLFCRKSYLPPMADAENAAPPNVPPVALAMPERRVTKGMGVSDGTLAGSVLELAQTLTKNNAILRERTEEKARLSKISGEFRKHLAWQAQRTQQLKRNLERLHNETQWLSTKASEVKQDAHVINHELRQATAELDKLKAARDTRLMELSTVEQELKLERDAAAAVGQLCSQARKALTAHSRERDGWKAEADRAQQEARKLKDRLEGMACKRAPSRTLGRLPRLHMCGRLPSHALLSLLVLASTPSSVDRQSQRPRSRCSVDVTRPCSLVPMLSAPCRGRAQGVDHAVPTLQAAGRRLRLPDCPSHAVDAPLVRLISDVEVTMW